MDKQNFYEYEPNPNETNNFLTDAEVDEMIDSMSSVNADNEGIKTIQEITNGDFDPSVLDDIEEDDKKIVTNINPVTGQTEGSSIASGYGLDSETDIFDDFLESTGVGDDINDINIDEVIAGMTTDEHPEISTSDFECIKNLVVKRNSGGTIKYSELPLILKQRIDQVIKANIGQIPAKSTKEVKNAMATSVIEEIYTNIVGDKINKVAVDLDTSIKNIAKDEIGDINSDARKKYHNVFITQFPELAKKYEESNPKKAKLLLDISEGYKQAYSLDDMYKLYTTTGKLKIKRIEIEKIMRTISEFNMKYERSTLTIKDISPAVLILDRHVNQRFSATSIKELIAVFCKYTMNMKPDNISEHTFMYYFINNILSLDIYDVNNEEEKEYYEGFIKNIDKFLLAISEKNNF